VTTWVKLVKLIQLISRKWDFSQRVKRDFSF